MPQLEQQNQEEVLETSKLVDANDVDLKNGLESLDDTITQYMKDIPKNIGEYFTDKSGDNYCRIDPNTKPIDFMERLKSSPNGFKGGNGQFLIHFSPEFEGDRRKPETKKNWQKLVQISNNFEQDPDKFKAEYEYQKTLFSEIRDDLSKYMLIPNEIGISGETRIQKSGPLDLGIFSIKMHFNYNSNIDLEIPINLESGNLFFSVDGINEINNKLKKHGYILDRFILKKL